MFFFFFIDCNFCLFFFKFITPDLKIFNSDLYTIFTNKDGHGKKGSIIAILKDTITIDVIPILHQIPLEKQNLVDEVTADMAGSMNLIAKKCFP